MTQIDNKVAKKDKPKKNRLVRVFGYCVNKLWLLLASAIIFLAVLHVALGLLLPEIDRYRADIVNWVEAKYDLNIDVEQISAKWSTDGPILTLTNFHLKENDSEQDILQVGKVSLYFDIIASVWNGRFSTQEIAIDNAELKFLLDRKLGVNLKKENELATSLDIDQTSNQLFDLLFGQKKITISNSDLKLYTLSGTEFDYIIKRIEVRKFADIHQLSGKLEYSEGGELSLVSEVYGDPSTSNSHSEIYLSGENLDLAKMPWVKNPAVSQPKSGNLSWELWGTWRDNHWSQASAAISLNNADFYQGIGNNTDQLDKTVKDNSLSVLFSWQHDSTDEGFLAIHDFILRSTDSEKGKVNELFAKFERKNIQEPSWKLVADGIQISPIVKYLADIGAFNKDNSVLLAKSDLSLLVERLSLSIDKLNDKWQSPEIFYQFSGLKYERLDGIPRLNGLSGKGGYFDQQGRLSIQASDENWEFGNLFRNPIHGQEIEGEFVWEIDSKHDIVLDVENFELTNDDFKLGLEGRYFYQDEQPIMSLYSEITNLNVSNKSLYLPVGLMTDHLVEYLDKGVKSGRLSLIKTVVRGPVHQFPYDNTEGIFVILGNLKNANYQYLHDWPMATNLTADLLFEGNGMDIIAHQANSMGNKVNFARAYVKDLSVAHPILELSLDVDSKDNTGRSFMNLSPIKSIAKSLQTLDYIGTMNTKIKLDVDLSGEGKPELNGSVTLNSENSKLTTSVITVDNISGQVKFNQSGLMKSDVKADYLGSPMQVSLVGQQNEEQPVLTLDVKGVLPAAGFSHFIGQRWKPFFSGETEFSSLIQIAPHDERDKTHVLFHSDLKGIKIDFPGEFGKSVDSVSELFLTLDVGEHSAGEIKWKDISGKWYWDIANSKAISSPPIIASESISQSNRVETENNNKKERVDNLHNLDLADSVDYGGDFFIGVDSVSNENIAPGIRVKGKLAKADLREWLKFIGRLNRTVEKSSLKVNQSKESKIEGVEINRSQSNDMVFESIDFDVGVLVTPLTDLNETNIEISKSLSKPWRFNLNSKQGDLSLVMNENEPWEARLSDFNLKLADSLFEEDKSKTIEPLSISDMFNIDLKCARCVIQGKDYGALKIKVRRTDNKVNFSGLVDHKHHNLVFSGKWSENSKGENHTRFEASLKSDNVGQLLKKWNLEAAIEDSSVDLKTSLLWDGTPWDFDYSDANGGIQVELGKGYLSEISDEKGRLFSLFNLQSIVRKLTFDFKDVYKKGFFYDKINGTFVLNDGIISTENVNIKGNVADVKLYGRTDLKEKNIEQIAVITPHLTSSFPVLAAWAVEPTTGLIVFLLDKIMEPAVEVATKIEYRIHGPFDEVVVDKIKTSRKKIKFKLENQTKETQLGTKMGTDPSSDFERNKKSDPNKELKSDTGPEIEAEPEKEPNPQPEKEKKNEPERN